MSQPQRPQFDMKNMIMAVALSMLIVFGWQYYYAAPHAKLAEQEAAIQQKTTAEMSVDGRLHGPRSCSRAGGHQAHQDRHA